MKPVSGLARRSPPIGSRWASTGVVYVSFVFPPMLLYVYVHYTYSSVNRLAVTFLFLVVFFAYRALQYLIVVRTTVL